MKPWRIALAVLLIGALASIVILTRPAQRTVYLGGPILTMDAANRVVEALGVEGESIGAVGSEAEVRAWAGDDARVVDLAGRALLPGFVDAHSHFPGAGIYYSRVVDLNSPPIGSVERMEQLVERLRSKARQTDAGDWVVGMGYDDTLLAERRHPTRRDLDRVSDQHPVVILHVSGHLSSVNSRGLERLGIDASTPDPEGGRIRREPGSNEPNGVLEETAANEVRLQALDLSLLDGIAVVREANRRYLAAGVTTAQSGLTNQKLIASLSGLSRIGLISLRLVLWPSMELADDIIDGRASVTSYDERWVRIGAVKIIADGSIQGYTGYLGQPYHVPPGDDPSYRGYPLMTRDELIERVGRYHANGFQVAVHGNGDAAIDDILDAFEQAQAAHPRPDARPIVIHAQMTRDDQLDRMQTLGVIPSFFSLHTYYWGDRHRDIFMGPERAARMSPARSAGERGLHYTIHCDTPVVPMEPLRLVWAAVNRRSTSGAVIGEAERIPVMDALRAVTIDAAYQHFDEQRTGSLEPGKLADLVILSASPLDEPERIDRIRVLETIVGGRTRYRADDS